MVKVAVDASGIVWFVSRHVLYSIENGVLVRKIANQDGRPLLRSPDGRVWRQEGESLLREVRSGATIRLPNKLPLYVRHLAFMDNSRVAFTTRTVSDSYHIGIGITDGNVVTILAPANVPRKSFREGAIEAQWDTSPWQARNRITGDIGLEGGAEIDSTYRVKTVAPSQRQLLFAAYGPDGTAYFIRNREVFKRTIDGLLVTPAPNKPLQLSFNYGAPVPLSAFAVDRSAIYFFSLNPYDARTSTFYSLNTGEIKLIPTAKLNGFHTLDDGTVIVQEDSGRLFEITSAGIGARFLPALTLSGRQAMAETRAKLYIRTFGSLVIYENGRARAVKLPAAPTPVRFDLLSLGNDRILLSNLEITGVSDCEAEEAPAIPPPSAIVNAASFGGPGQLSTHGLFTAFVPGWEPRGGLFATFGSEGGRIIDPNSPAILVMSRVESARPGPPPRTVDVPILYADERQVTF